MFQVAAALLFAVAAGFGLTVILAMLKSNENAILSALMGEGAFPLDPAPQPGATQRRVTLRRAAPRPVRAAIRARPELSRAA